MYNTGAAMGENWSEEGKAMATERQLRHSKAIADTLIKFLKD